MAKNIRKSFNFRSGLQVDNDSFYVNPNGLVGIGTSIPTEAIDAIGNAKISGLTTTTNLGVAETANFYGDLNVDGDSTFGNQSTDTTTVTGILTVTGRADIDNVRINGNTVTTTSGNLVLDADAASNLIDVNANVDISGITTFTNTTQNTLGNVNTGSVQLDGGAGIAKNLSVGGNLDVTGTINVGVSTVSQLTVSNLTNDSVVIVGTGGKLEDDAQLTFNGTTFTIGETTASTNTTTGALVVSGGIGVGGDINVSGGIDVDGTTDLDNTNVVGILTVTGQADIDEIRINGDTISNKVSNQPVIIQANGTGKIELKDSVVTINDSTDSTSTSTGALVVTGGIGVGGSINAGSNTITAATFSGNATSADTVDTTETTSGTNYLVFADSSSSSSGETMRVNSSFYLEASSTASSNNLFVRGDITAFAGAASDDRLKTNRETIPNALEKVLSLSGFTFTWNEKAIELGFVPEVSQVGVSAQQVQSVLPEAVKQQELDGEEILTVKYEKLVPILIEAIKELNAKVEALEQKLSDK